MEIRYFGGNTRYYGINAGDTYYKSASLAEEAYDLPSTKNAKYVEIVQSQKSCVDALGDGLHDIGPLFLVGGVNAGGLGVNQWVAFNADDWEYFQYEPTYHGVEPSNVNVEHRAPRCFHDSTGPD